VVYSVNHCRWLPLIVDLSHWMLQRLGRESRVSRSTRMECVDGGVAGRRRGEERRGEDGPDGRDGCCLYLDWTDVSGTKHRQM
jgi:hypothetical protein